MSAIADDKTKIGIDESPISPVERRDSLEKHLQHRPDPQDLKDRHILLDTNAAPFVASAPPLPMPADPFPASGPFKPNKSNSNGHKPRTVLESIWRNDLSVMSLLSVRFASSQPSRVLTVNR